MRIAWAMHEPTPARKRARPTTQPSKATPVYVPCNDQHGNPFELCFTSALGDDMRRQESSHKPRKLRDPSGIVVLLRRHHAPGMLHHLLVAMSCAPAHCQDFWELKLVYVRKVLSNSMRFRLLLPDMWYHHHCTPMGLYLRSTLPTYPAEGARARDCA